MSQYFETASLLEHFCGLADLQAEHLLDHQLLDIISLTICDGINGADSWVDIENYGKAKADCLRGFRELAQGIPSHDTIACLFIALDPEALKELFHNWVGGALRHRVLMWLSGKRPRGSQRSCSCAF